MSRFEIKKLRIKWLGILASCLLLVASVGVLVVTHLPKAYAGDCPNPAVNTCQPPAGIQNFVQDQVVSADQGCADRLSSASGATARAKVDNSQPYASIDWITNQGNPTNSGNPGGNVLAPIHAANVDLQENHMQFICAVLVKNTAQTTGGIDYSTRASIAGDPSSQVTNGNYPQDRDPYCDSCGGVHAASKYEQRVKTVGASVNSATDLSGNPVPGGDGNITNLDTSTLLRTIRIDTSRYWLSNTTEGFTYNFPSGDFNQPLKVSVTLNVRRVSTYHNNLGQSGAVSQCDTTDGSVIPIAATTEAGIGWGNCPALPITETFIIYPHEPFITNLRATPSCSAINGFAQDMDRPGAKIGIVIREFKPDGTRWRYPSSGSIQTDADHTFSINMSDIVAAAGGANEDDASPGWNQRSFDVIALGVNGAGDPDGNDSTYNIQVGPCADISCQNTYISMDTLTVGSAASFSVWVKAANTTTAPVNVGGGSAPPKFTITVTGPSGNVPYSPSPVPYGSYTQPYVYSDQGTFTPTAPGTYTVKWGWGYPSGAHVDTNATLDGGGNPTCNDSDKAGYSPYFNVLGGDIAAGVGGVADSCDETGTSQIVGQNTNTSGSPNYFGGSTTGAAFATGTSGSIITNFISGLGLSGDYNTAPATTAGAPNPLNGNYPTPAKNGHAVSFANTVGETLSQNGYGGDFGGNGYLPCMTDYYSKHTGSALGASITSGIINTLSPSTTYNYDVNPGAGTFQIGDAAHTEIDVNKGDTINLYVYGNVYISSNIKYVYSSVREIPRFNLYVKGKITIDPNVTELHGVYVAQMQTGPPTITGGTISTCDTPAANGTLPFATCNKQLKVYGAMIAENKMIFMRTYGSIAAAVDPTLGSIPAEPAEVFIYSPELWLNAPSTPGLDLQSYTSLPPVL